MSPRGSLLRWLALVLASMAFTLSAADAEAAQQNSRRPIAAVRTQTPPKIDGELTDSAWKTAPTADVFWDTDRGITSVDQTTAYILYDETYVYVAFHCKDRFPDRILGRETIVE